MSTCSMWHLRKLIYCFSNEQHSRDLCCLRLSSRHDIVASRLKARKRVFPVNYNVYWSDNNDMWCIRTLINSGGSMGAWPSFGDCSSSLCGKKCTDQGLGGLGLDGRRCTGLWYREKESIGGCINVTKVEWCRLSNNTNYYTNIHTYKYKICVHIHNGPADITMLVINQRRQ